MELKSTFQQTSCSKYCFRCSWIRRTDLYRLLALITQSKDTCGAFKEGVQKKLIFDSICPGNGGRGIFTCLSVRLHTYPSAIAPVVVCGISIAIPRGANTYIRNPMEIHCKKFLTCIVTKAHNSYGSIMRAMANAMGGGGAERAIALGKFYVLQLTFLVTQTLISQRAHRRRVKSVAES